MSNPLTIAQIRQMLSNADEQEYLALSRAFASDERKGVEQELLRCRKRLDAQRVEQERLESLYAFDARFAEKGMVVGLDEVGRGAIAGPLAVGAVVLSPDEPIAGLDDSKKLTPLQRENVARDVERSSIASAVFFVDAEDIDRHGMSACLRRAFKGALESIISQGVQPAVVLIDGNKLSIDEREVNVVKGDSKSACIAAASIIAKVSRDHMMVEEHSAYPQYGFSAHKGYGTSEHIEAIEASGLCPLHRRTFCRSFDQPRLF